MRYSNIRVIITDKAIGDLDVGDLFVDDQSNELARLVARELRQTSTGPSYLVTFRTGHDGEVMRWYSPQSKVEHVMI